jgi:hypothetical protein
MNNIETMAKLETPNKEKQAGANPGPSSGWLGWLERLLTNQLFT